MVAVYTLWLLSVSSQWNLAGVGVQIDFLCGVYLSKDALNDLFLWPFHKLMWEHGADNIS